MERRAAIRNLMLATAGTMLWAGCRESYVSLYSLYKDGKLNLDVMHFDYLRKISDAILPLKELSNSVENPAIFMMRQINDLRSPADVLTFVHGFEAFKTLISAANISMTKSPRQVPLGIIKEVVTSNPPADDLLQFIGDVRWLSIWNLKSSEHYMTNFQEYALIPPTFRGDVLV